MFGEGTGKGRMENDSEAPESQFLVYTDPTGKTRVDVRIVDESVWLTQQDMASLFQETTPSINQHILNIFDEGELNAVDVERTFQMQRVEGTRVVRRQVLHDNLDMVISVGYRVRSRVATQFRIWATNQLRELIVKGFVLDDDRLKTGLITGPPLFNGKSSRGMPLFRIVREVTASGIRSRAGGDPGNHRCTGSSVILPRIVSAMAWRSAI